MSASDLGTWLGNPGQPAARFRYLVDVEGESPHSGEAREALVAIARRGWAADILRQQDRRGFWVGRESLYRPKYVATNWRLLVLAELGLTVRHPAIRKAVDLMFADYGSSDGPFSRVGGEPHFCFVGNTARMMILLGLGSDRRVRASLDWLADQQLDDGGWDCFGRPKGTLDCWEALAAYAAIGRSRWTRKRKAAVERGAEFYLERELLHEGRKRYASWWRLHYPVHYYYDVLVGLETLARLGYGDDSRTRRAKALLREKRRPDGKWPLESVHPDLARGANYDREKGVQPFALERRHGPSKWITLRALSVLRDEQRGGRHRVRKARVRRRSGLAPDAVVVPVEVVRVGRKYPEVAVGDVYAIEIRRRRRDAHVRIRGIAVARRGRGGTSAPSGTSEFTRRAKCVVGLGIARGDHRGVGVRPVAVDDREHPTVRVRADLPVVLVHERGLPRAQGSQVVPRQRPAAFAQLRRVDEHEADCETRFDVERVAVDDARHVGLEAQADGVGTRRGIRRWWRWWRLFTSSR